MKINEVITEAGFWKGVASAIAPEATKNLKQNWELNKSPKKYNSGDANLAADVDAQAAANATSASNASTAKMQAANKSANTALAKAKRERFVAILKQQADRQGSISMTDIGKKIPKQGEYADATRRREAIHNVAQELQQLGATVTGPATTQTAPKVALPTIGGIGPNDPRYAALAAKTKNAPATPRT